MKGVRNSEETIIKILNEIDGGLPVREACRKYSVSDATIYKWRQKFGGMEVADARRLRILEEENRKLKRLVADQALDIIALKDINSRKW